jgi:hypothetical protein
MPPIQPTSSFAKRYSTAVRRSLLLVGLVALLIAGYLLILAFPEPLFAHEYSYGAFHVFSRTPLDDRVRSPLDEIERRLRQSSLYRPGMVHRVFIAETAGRYAFLNGPYRGAMARNFELNDSIFVPRLDLETGEVVHFDGRRGPIVWIVGHEVVHSLIRKRVGLVAAWTLPRWKREGYPEYVASTHGMSLEEGVHALDSSLGLSIIVKSGYSIPRRYFESEMLWRYLLEVRRLGFEDVIRSRFGESEIRREMTAWVGRQPRRADRLTPGSYDGNIPLPGIGTKEAR